MEGSLFVVKRYFVIYCLITIVMAFDCRGSKCLLIIVGTLNRGSSS